MKFTVTTSKDRYSTRPPSLLKLGFNFNAQGFVINQGKVEINTLEELLEFEKEFGAIIIFGDSIEIYNSCRE